MPDDVLALFAGLTQSQARQLRLQIMPTLWDLRRSITGETLKLAPLHAGATRNGKRPSSAPADDRASADQEQPAP